MKYKVLVLVLKNKEKESFINDPSFIIGPISNAINVFTKTISNAA